MRSPKKKRTASKAEEVIPETKLEDASETIAKTPKQEPYLVAKLKFSHLKIRFAFGLVSLVIGLLGANLALFNWVVKEGVYSLLGEYARYVCAYGGFGAMIFGATLINDYLILKNSIVVRHDEDRIAEHEIMPSCELEKEEEKAVVAQ